MSFLSIIFCFLALLSNVSFGMQRVGLIAQRAQIGAFKDSFLKSVNRSYSDDPYKVFNVRFDATSEEVRQAYLKKVKEAHPDVGGSHEQFIEIKAAWDDYNNNFKGRAASGSQNSEYSQDNQQKYNNRNRYSSGKQQTEEQDTASYQSWKTGYRAAASGDNAAFKDWLKRTNQKERLKLLAVVIWKHGNLKAKAAGFGFLGVIVGIPAYCGYKSTKWMYDKFVSGSIDSANGLQEVEADSQDISHVGLQVIQETQGGVGAIDADGVANLENKLKVAAFSLAGLFVAYTLWETCSIPSFEQIVEKYVVNTSESDHEIVKAQFYTALKEYGYVSEKDQKRAELVLIEHKIIIV